MKLEAYCGDYFIIQKNIQFRFGSIDSATKFFSSIMAKEQFYKDGFNCFVSGTNMGFDGFMLKAENKGVYCNDRDMYDQFITPDVIKGMKVNYIQFSGDKDILFEEAYERALKMKDKLEQAFSTTVDVFIYENQSYTLHKKYLININKLGERTERRYYQPYEEQFLASKHEYGLKKNVKQGKEQSIKMQNAILVACQKS